MLPREINFTEVTFTSQNADANQRFDWLSIILDANFAKGFMQSVRLLQCKFGKPVVKLTNAPFSRLKLWLASSCPYAYSMSFKGRTLSLILSTFLRKL